MEESLTGDEMGRSEVVKSDTRTVIGHVPQQRKKHRADCRRRYHRRTQAKCHARGAWTNVKNQDYCKQQIKKDRKKDP